MSAQRQDVEEHRKRVKHFDEPGHAHLLTFSCYQQRPLLADPTADRLLSAAITRAACTRGFGLMAYVFMPEHVHLLVRPLVPTCRIADVLWAIKRPSSYRMKKHIEKANPALVRELTVRDGPETRGFRFWQEGGGHDRNVTSVKDAVTAAEYLHNNPVRRGLCGSASEWKWSSWRYYHVPEWTPDPDLPVVHGFSEA